jgi:hypothetical protein
VRRKDAMADTDPDDPVSRDDFPEFAEPPRHTPPATALEQGDTDRPRDSAHGQVDDVIARLRHERDQRRT